MRLFVYGTLMFPAIAEAVMGRVLPAQPALLVDYRCQCVRGEAYPAIVSSRGEQVDGLLFEGVDAAMLARLDEYEGAEYERQRVDVRLQRQHDGAAAQFVVTADAYVWRPELQHLLLGSWSAQTFAAKHLSRYLEELGTNPHT